MQPLARYLQPSRDQRDLELRVAGTPSDPDPDSDPLSLIISKQQREQLRVALVELSAADQEILHLSFFEGLTPAEIADRLNEPAERIRKRKSRALLRLRSAFLEKTETGHESGSPPTY